MTGIFMTGISMQEFNKLDIQNEREIVKWLLNHEKSGLYNTFEGIGNWKKTGFIELDTNPKFIVDCSECLEALLFTDLYYNHYGCIMAKYEPTEEHFEQNRGRVNFSLESYLKLHNKHLDIL